MRDKNQQMRFKFGENWMLYIENLDVKFLDSVKIGLVSLLSQAEINNKKVIDVGSGSGVHALGFLNLGARHVDCIDIDKSSVRATKNILSDFWMKNNYTVSQKDVLNLKNLKPNSYDIVYSWGVLHHTGDLHQAIINCSSLVKQHGKLVLGLYRKTPFCKIWRKIKIFYISSPVMLQRLMEYIYLSILIVVGFVKSVMELNFRSTKRARGMKLRVDIRDWLGGYPYESISPYELDQLLTQLNFKIESSIIPPKSMSILGSGCNQYVYKKM